MACTGNFHDAEDDKEVNGEIERRFQRLDALALAKAARTGQFREFDDFEDDDAEDDDEHEGGEPHERGNERLSQRPDALALAKAARTGQFREFEDYEDDDAEDDDEQEGHKQEKGRALQEGGSPRNDHS